MQPIYFLKAHHAGNQYRPVLTQYHRVPTSTTLYWPNIQLFDGLDHVNQIFSESIPHWQKVPPCFDPVSPSTDQYHPILTQYHRVPTSTALYWPSIQWFDGLDHVNQIFSESISHWQPVPPCFDPVSPSTDQYHPILTQYHQVTTSAALYRPSTIKYQSVPPNTDPVPPSTNK